MSEEEVKLRAISSLEMLKDQGINSEKRQKELREEALREIYEGIIFVLKDYIDTSEENYTLIALWIMGTYFHDKFLTYPYLFFNAMRGGGKTRVLKLISHLAKNGDMLASLSEAVLFRTQGTLCIDEFERIESKDKNALRELLNTAYKRGGQVMRMRKRKTIDGETQVVESFPTFRPISMANISGMEETLGDRCISVVLEKSNNIHFTQKVEDFDANKKLKSLVSELSSVVRCVDVQLGGMYTEWNEYINNITTLTTLTTQYYTFFTKISEIKIDGRNLELFFPLIIMAQEVGILDNFLIIVQKIISLKKTDDIIESKDIQLYSFVASQDNSWHTIKDLTSQFRIFCSDDYSDEPWLNPKWMGKALKRLNLVAMKRRIGEGINVILNVEKAKKQMEIFK